MLEIPPHARKRMVTRGVTQGDVEEAVEKGEIIFEEVNHRFGLKRYSKLQGLYEDLIVVWRWGREENKIVVTLYWRTR